VKETELAQIILEHLQAEGWETWQEVTLPLGRADIVAKSGPLVWVVETKLSLSLDLIEQAFCRLPYAHLVSIAVPERKNGLRNFTRRLLTDAGIGLFEVTVYVGGGSFVRDRSPSLHRKVNLDWTRTLCDGHKTALAAGSKAGGQWTPFRQTCAEALRFVTANPGCDPKQLIEGIKHHYYNNVSARTSLIRRIDEGIIPGLELRREGRRIKIFPKGGGDG